MKYKYYLRDTTSPRKLEKISSSTSGNPYLLVTISLGGTILETLAGYPPAPPPPITPFYTHCRPESLVITKGNYLFRSTYSRLVHYCLQAYGTQLDEGKYDFSQIICPCTKMRNIRQIVVFSVSLYEGCRYSLSKPVYFVKDTNKCSIYLCEKEVWWVDFYSEHCFTRPRLEGEWGMLIRKLADFCC